MEGTEVWRRVPFLHNNTLSRAELCDADGDVFDVHYGDVLIKYSSVIDITKANLPRIIDAGKVSGCDSLHNGDVVIADTAEDETAGKCTELRGIDNEKVFQDYTQSRVVREEYTLRVF
ncbi:hypothetical protein [Bifidobacterium canis]|uniref:hypothetical protein n=1 Tax=Bifidobacterium canis TaxID=2610880 RepID=UPI0012D8C238|nr:hypothetical protein [Bifidobacterium canis]